MKQKPKISLLKHITSLNLSLGPDCGDGCAEVNRTNTIKLNLSTSYDFWQMPDQNISAQDFNSTSNRSLWHDDPSFFLGFPGCVFLIVCVCVLTVCVYGVLGAGRGGGLRAVAAGTVQRVPAAPRGVRIQRTQRQRQLIPGRARLRGGEDELI